MENSQNGERMVSAPVKKRTLRWNANFLGGMMLADIEVVSIVTGIVMAVMVIANMVRTGRFDAEGMFSIEGMLNTDALIILSVVGSFFGNGVLMGIVYLVRRKSISFETKRGNMLKIFPVCALLMLQVNLLVSSTDAVITELLGINAAGNVSAMLGEGDFLTMLICVGILAPVIEEFAFRKVIFSLCREYGFCFAAVVSAAMFALMHQNFTQFAFTFFAGLIFAYAYERSGRLIFPIMLHMINNCYSVLETFYVIPAWVSIGINLLLLAAFAAMMIAFIAKKRSVGELFDCEGGEAGRLGTFFKQPLVIIYAAICVAAAVFTLFSDSLMQLIS